jgi:N-acyl-L-homoserine lactone synthetase
VKVIPAQKSEEKRKAYQLRYKMMCQELEWIPSAGLTDQEEHDVYDEEQSIIFLAEDKSGNCLGTSRLILPGKIKLPIEINFNLYPGEFIEKIHGELTYCVEVSRFVVPHNEAYKPHEITLMLCTEMIRTCMNMGVSHMLMSIDVRFFRLLKMLGYTLAEIGETKLYMGSKTTPGVLTLKNLLPELKVKKPSLYDYLAADGGMVREKTLV